jgi:hypothetical protein
MLLHMLKYKTWERSIKFRVPEERGAMISNPPPQAPIHCIAPAFKRDRNEYVTLDYMD